MTLGVCIIIMYDFFQLVFWKEIQRLSSSDNLGSSPFKISIKQKMHIGETLQGVIFSTANTMRQCLQIN